jgi:hypothetical protein
VTGDHAVSGSGGRSWLARALLEQDRWVLADAVRHMDGLGRPEDRQLAVRRALDRYAHDMTPRLAGSDYARLAEEMTAAGETRWAGLLREVAGTDHLVAGADAQWSARYAGRAETFRGQVARAVTETGLIDLDPLGPAAGIDGASYAPGCIHDPAGLRWVVVVTGRGMSEVVAGFSSYLDQRQWVADRCLTASGPLAVPAVTPPPRVVQEEQVLAYLLASAEESGDVMSVLGPEAFTADARFEIWSAMTAAALMEPCRAFTITGVTGQLRQREAQVPAGELHRFGGVGMPRAHAYLARLAETPVSRDQASASVAAITAEDAEAHASARAGHQAQPSGVQPAIGRCSGVQPGLNPAAPEGGQLLRPPLHNPLPPGMPPRP